MSNNENKQTGFDLFSAAAAPSNDMWGASSNTTDIFASFTPANDPFASAPAAETKSTIAPVVPITPEVKPATSGVKGADEKKADAKKNAKKPQKKKAEDIVVDPSWTVAYAAQQYHPPHEGMKLEDLRAYLELDYPELSKERTKWEFDEDKKLVVPVISGAKMG